MRDKKIIIVGAGPSGASLAYYLSRDGFDLKVYEASSRPGSRPCGWGTPRQIKRYIDIPKEYILNEISSIDLFLDRELLHSVSFPGGWGYIIDKPGWLSYLLEGVDVRYNARLEISKEYYSRQGNDVIVLATGGRGPSKPVLTLNVIEYVLETNGVEPDKIEFWFDSSQVGFAWVFPRGERYASVGVGAFKEFDYLRTYLDTFIKSHPALSSAKIVKLGGDKLRVDGISLKNANPEENVYIVGEAMGAVFPITGEGIRPSVISSFALYRALRNETSFKEEIMKTGLPLAMNVQKIILWIAMNSSPEERAKLLTSMPLEKSVSLATGEITFEMLREILPEYEGLLMELKNVNLEPDEFFNLNMEQV